MYWPILILIILGWISFNLLQGRSHVTVAQVYGMFWPIKNMKYILEQRNNFKKLRKEQNDNILFVSGIVKGSTYLSYAIKRYKSKISKR